MIPVGQIACQRPCVMNYAGKTKVNIRLRARVRVCMCACARARAVTEHKVQQSSAERTTKHACYRFDYRNQCICSEKFLFANLVRKFLKIFIWQIGILYAVPSNNH